MKKLKFKMQSVANGKQQEAEFVRLDGDSIDDLLSDGLTPKDLAEYAIIRYNTSRVKNEGVCEIVNGSIEIVEE